MFSSQVIIVQWGEILSFAFVKIRQIVGIATFVSEKCGIHHSLPGLFLAQFIDESRAQIAFNNFRSLSFGCFARPVFDLVLHSFIYLFKRRKKRIEEVRLNLPFECLNWWWMNGLILKIVYHLFPNRKFVF